MTSVERALNSIGKKCFVENYEDFKLCIDKKKLAEKLLKENSNATSFSAQLTRINYAAWIFENKLESEALKIIIESNRVDTITQNKAKQQLKSI